MKKQEIIDLGTKLGLSYNAITKNDVGFLTFHGVENQIFKINLSWSEDIILDIIGSSLILMGKRLKMIEIKNAITYE